MKDYSSVFSKLIWFMVGVLVVMCVLLYAGRGEPIPQEQARHVASEDQGHSVRQEDAVVASGEVLVVGEDSQKWFTGGLLGAQIEPNLDPYYVELDAREESRELDRMPLKLGARELYSDYVLKNGMPEGVGWISVEDARYKRNMWSIVRFAWKMYLEYVNVKKVPELYPRDDSMGVMPSFATAVFERQEDGVKVWFYDEAGYLGRTWKYSEDMSRIHQEFFMEPSERIPADKIDYIWERPRDEAFELKVDMEVQYDGRGRFRRVRLVAPGTDTTAYYMNNTGGFEYEYNSDDQITLVRYLVDKGQGLDYGWLEYGYAQKALSYDHGLLKRIELWDDKGRLISGKDGYAMVEYERNETQNINRETYYGVDRQPTYCSGGYVIKDYMCNYNGTVYEIRYLGDDGEMIRPKVGVSGLYYSYDDNGRIVEVRCLDAMDCYGWCKDRYTAMYISYTDRGQIARVDFEDIYHDINTKLGYASFTQEYDDRGNCVRESYYNADGSPALCADGFASTRREYNCMGNRTWQWYYGLDGSPALYKDWFASYNQVFDERGYQTEGYDRGLDGRLLSGLGEEAYHIMTRDIFGYVDSECCYTAKGTPVKGTEGGYREYYKYDSQGHLVGGELRDSSGQLMKGYEGWAIFVQERDERGFCTREVYCDTHGRKVNNIYGYAEQVSEVDNLGNITHNWYLDVNGNLVIASNEGYAEYVQTFDSRGWIQSIEHYGINGEPVMSSDGYASCYYILDHQGYVDEVHYYDAEGNEITLP